MGTIEQLDDNLEYYLYLGEISHGSHVFPVFYIPLQVKIEGQNVSIEFDRRILINKKAIDYIATVLSKETKVRKPSPVKNRIIYIPDETSIADCINPPQDILKAFDFDGFSQLNEITYR